MVCTFYSKVVYCPDDKKPLYFDRNSILYRVVTTEKL